MKRLASIAIAAALVPPTVAVSVGALYVMWILDVARAKAAKNTPTWVARVKAADSLSVQLADTDAVRAMTLTEACAWLATARDIDALPVVGGVR